MQTGMINSENLGQILRAISQKRQHGILEITFPERQLSILFFAGKIVDAFYNDSGAADEVAMRLARAGYINDYSAETSFDNYKELFLWLNNRGVDQPLVDEGIFKNAVRHRNLDLLYTLNLDTPAIYIFKMQMPEYDKDFTTAVSIGQMLLDRVSLETERERFLSLFPDNSLIITQSIKGISLSDEEEKLYAKIGDGITKETLISKCPVSIFHIQSALLSMHERALIEVEVAARKVEAATVLNQDMLTALEGTTERPFVETALRPEAVPTINGKIQVSQQSPSIVLQPAVHHKATEKPKRSQRSLSVINATLLQNNKLPDMIALIFAISALIIPILFWRPWLASF